MDLLVAFQQLCDHICFEKMIACTVLPSFGIAAPGKNILAKLLQSQVIIMEFEIEPFNLSLTVLCG